MDAAEAQTVAWVSKNEAFLSFLGLDKANLCLTFSAGLEQKSIFQIYIDNSATPMVRSFLPLESFRGLSVEVLVFKFPLARSSVFLRSACARFWSVS